jgi:multidrug resistance efflux pump
MSRETEAMPESERTHPDAAAEAPPPAKPPADPVRRWTFILLAVAALLLAWHLRADRVTPMTSQARVNALVVPIAPEVSGTVTGVFVDNNQAVSAGQELFQIDIERYRLSVQTAEANLESARQAIGAAEANVKSAEASIASARANVVRARQDSDRMRAIRAEDPGAISERRLQSAEASLASAEAQLNAAEANRDKALQDLGAEGERNSRILQARAALDQARLDLERATVRAPEDGVITGLRLDKGNFAAAGAPQITFIATHNIWLQADFTENNLGRIEPGQEAGIVFDALPGEIIRGRVRELSFGVAVDTAPLGSLPTVQNDPNWLREAQRYPVLIDFELPRDQGRYPLKVGSQATVVVYTGDHLLVNPLARLYLWLVSILTYAY